MTIIATKHGRMDIRHPQDYISQHLLEQGHYEWYVVELLISQLDINDPGIVLDIGANQGTTTLPIAARFPSHTVHSFELQPYVTEILKDNVLLNQLTNVVVHPHGLSNSNADIYVKQYHYDTVSNIGAFSINPLVWQNAPESQGIDNESVKVTVKRLDDMEFDQKIKLIKMDAEGSEFDILQGGLHTLESHDWPTIVYELWGHRPWWKEKAVEIQQFLRSRNYHLTSHSDTIVAVHV
jgi:FkbM family methyltransferase